MKNLLRSSLATLACLSVFSFPQISFASHHPHRPNLNGTWTLDHKASASLDPLMTHIGAGFFERKAAGIAKLNATFRQTEHTLTIATRGPAGFALDETLHLDGRTVPSNLDLLGATSLNVRTAWSRDNEELIETRRIKTKQGKDGQLVIKRYLINGGKSMVVAFSLKLDAEPGTTSARQTWNKQA